MYRHGRPQSATHYSPGTLQRMTTPQKDAGFLPLAQIHLFPYVTHAAHIFFRTRARSTQCQFVIYDDARRWKGQRLDFPSRRPGTVVPPSCESPVSRSLFDSPLMHSLNSRRRCSEPSRWPCSRSILFIPHDPAPWDHDISPAH